MDLWRGQTSTETLVRRVGYGGRKGNRAKERLTHRARVSWFRFELVRGAMLPPFRTLKDLAEAVLKSPSYVYVEPVGE
jgi:hypothetical protein